MKTIQLLLIIEIWINITIYVFDVHLIPSHSDGKERHEKMIEQAKWLTDLRKIKDIFSNYLVNKINCRKN